MTITTERILLLMCILNVNSCRLTVTLRFLIFKFSYEILLDLSYQKVYILVILNSVYVCIVFQNLNGNIFHIGNITQQQTSFSKFKI